MFMTIQSNVKDKILATPSETSKVENAPAEMLRDLDQQMEKRADDGKGYRGNGEVGNELGDVLGVVVLAINRGRGGYKVGGKWGRGTVMVRRAHLVFTVFIIYTIGLSGPSDGLRIASNKYFFSSAPGMPKDKKTLVDKIRISDSQMKLRM
ncbi:hypothetical protein Tco_0054426 [Tanacetum coccineum]